VSTMNAKQLKELNKPFEITDSVLAGLTQAARDAEREVFIQMLKNRICFDQSEGRGCDHQLCYGNLNLIRDLEEGKTK